MLDLGRVQQFLAREKRTMVVPPSPAPTTPAAWIVGDHDAWNAAMGAIGFDPAGGYGDDEARWIYAIYPTDTAMGVCIIVYWSDRHGVWMWDYSISSEQTDDTSDWTMGIEATRATTPLELAAEAREDIARQLQLAAARLLDGRR